MKLKSNRYFLSFNIALMASLSALAATAGGAADAIGNDDWMPPVDAKTVEIRKEMRARRKALTPEERVHAIDAVIGERPHHLRPPRPEGESRNRP